MANPFRLRWLQGWLFQTVLMDGYVQIEAHGYGIRLRTPLQVAESPADAADRLVLEEDRRRRSLLHAWRRGRISQWIEETGGAAAPELSDPAADPYRPAPSAAELFAADSPLAAGSPFLVEEPSSRPDPDPVEVRSVSAVAG